MMNRFLTLSAVFALTACAAFAKPNLSGDWKLNPAKSDFGPMPAPEKMTRKIGHKDPVLKSIQVQSGQQGEVTSELTYTTDGKESVNKTARGEVKGTAKWENDSIVIDSKREIQGVGEITQHEVWSLSADGKTLTVVNKLNTPQGEFEIKTVLEKQ